MIRKYTLGSPIETESVIMDIPVESGEIPYFTLNKEEKTLSLRMKDSELVYGLGETVRGMNKRGWEYISKNADEPHHYEDRRSLYASQNFIILFDSSEAKGFYFDTPGIVTFDIGYTHAEELVVKFEDLDVDLYVLEGGTARELVHAFRQLTGRSYIPPKWAFGFGQSRWSYIDEDAVREVADRYEQAGIPLDMIYLDIDYMERYKDFTLNGETFPDFEAFAREMKERRIHLIPIIDAGVKIEEGYDVYEEGVKNGYFVTKEDGSELVAAVWPGQVHFPDFLNADARRWFGDKYKILMDQGIDGFWNDMNEPAIFYTQDRLEEAFAAIEQYKGINLDLEKYWGMLGLLNGLSNNPEDYTKFYHNMNGKRIRHDKVHNIYGYNMTRSAGEAFERLSPDKRILMFSRSSYIGMHRYGGVWTGDNCSWWSHILLNLQEMPALNMCGFLYSGADTGGFGCDTTQDLVMRWTALSIFTPLFRNHAALGTRRQELYQFDRIEDFRNIVNLRYALLPYIYSEFMKAALRDEMYFVPLAFEYTGDERAVNVEDQILVGESLMIAPIYTQNARGRYVYLPEDMKLIRFRSVQDYDEEILEAGDHYVKAELNEVLVFLRKGHVLPLAAPTKSVEEIDYSTILYLTYDADPESYELYDDDGISRIRN